MSNVELFSEIENYLMHDNPFATRPSPEHQLTMLEESGRISTDNRAPYSMHINIDLNDDSDVQ